MKKNLKSKVFLLIFILVVLLVPKKLFAVEFIEPFEYTEAYKKYLELTEEERKGVLVPRIYKIPTTSVKSSTPSRLLKSGSATESRYFLKEVISDNMKTKSQENTNSCWTFATMACLETNLALKDYYNGDTSRVYDFSERHLEYMTSRTFLDGINEKGFNREVNSGGNWSYSEPYLINGYGAIPESEMPFEDNKDKIKLSKIKNKTTVTKVIDTAWFDSKTPDEVTSSDMKTIKEHIKYHGAIFTGVVVKNSNYWNGSNYYSNNNSQSTDHAVAIVGWNDNYSKDNFKIKPSQNGAWIAKNSWGNSSEYIYISYDDAWIYEMMSGIENVSYGNINYDNIYFYNEYGNTAYPGLKTKSLYMATVFNKKTSSTEYINEIALNVLDTYDCTVYVNPNGTSKALKDLQQVELKAGTKETLEAGYHTLEFKRPIRITGDNFTIVVKEETKQKDYTLAALEAKMPDTDDWDCVKTEKGKCFITAEEYIIYDYWEDCSQLSSTSEGYWPDGDLTIRAFTTNTSLKDIEITTIPNTTTYVEGDKFDATGMVVTAYYNNGASETVIDYSIENGTNLQVGQTAVTISYTENGITKKVTQGITVKKQEHIHSFNNGEITKEPTCKEEGTKTYTCTVCGATKTEAVPKTTTHNWNAGVITKEATCKEEGIKTYTCTVCGATKTETVPKTTTHNWNAGVVTKAATCKEEGTKTYTCTVCGATKTEAVPKTTTHNWNAGVITKEATCKEEGIKTYTCTVCGETKTEAIAKTTTHTWDNGKVTKEPTCKETGTKTYTCTVCGETKTETIAKTTTHTWDNGKVTKEPTCKETGTKTYTCTVCGETKTEAIAKTTTHTWDNGKVTKEPTCKETGTKTYTCTVCGETKTETIPKTAHNYVDGTCTECGKEDPYYEEPISLTTESSKYNLESGYLSLIQPKTTVSILKEEIITYKAVKTNAEKITVYKGTTPIEGTEKVATGMKIEFRLGEQSRRYTIAVAGDVNGDGEADFKDIVLINKHRLGKTALNGTYLLAGDVNRDGEVKFQDIVKVNKFRLGKIMDL